MSHDRNIVRDRTLVLRVLVPGLHTRLNDKITSIQEGEDSKPVTPVNASASGISVGGAKSLSADQLLNLDGVACLPSSKGSTLWHFR